MEINITNAPQTVITIAGRLDTLNSPNFEKAVAPIIAGDMQDIVLDCTVLDYISSSGLRILLTMQKSATAKKGKLTLKGIKPVIREIFDITGFSSMFYFE